MNIENYISEQIKILDELDKSKDKARKTIEKLSFLKDES